MADLETELSRRVEAQDLLDKPLIQEFLAKIRENLRKEYENSKAADKEGREDAWRMMKVVNEFERHFVSIIETGKMAEKQLSMADKVKTMFG